MKGLVVLGNQLFDPKFLRSSGIKEVFMREDFELCTYFKFHQQKIVFFLAAMRTYADELRAAGFNVTYQKLERSAAPYESHMQRWLKRKRLKSVVSFEIEDKFFEKRVAEALADAGVAHEVLPTPMFLTGRPRFAAYLKQTKRPFMKTFYEAQRKRLRILLDERGEPEGGRWSFDEMNRRALPKTVQPPAIPTTQPSPIERDVIALCEKHFADHPGKASDHWLPVNRAGARQWLKLFINERLAHFGPFEDAIPARSEFLFHSVLTPFLNTGLLTPGEVVKAVLAEGRRRKLNITSIEGFVRQVIGWREFMRGIYRNYSEKQDASNFWKHHRKLKDPWYEGNTGIAPLDQVITKVSRRGYAHHIERLMVVGNLMLLLEVHPREAHRWFMEMFIDSADWVMGPNVYGMGIFSDGGIFATKPYICGSNYYRKMGGYKKEAWCDGVDGLYWSFVEKHRDFFSRNPRLSMMVRTVEKMDADRKATIYAAADKLRAHLTSS